MLSGCLRALQPLLTAVLLTIVIRGETSAQQLEVTIEVSSGNLLYTLEAGMAIGASDGFDPGIDIFAPPAPPMPSFDAALGWSNDRWYRTIIAPTFSQVIFSLIYQFDGTEAISFQWDPALLAPQGSFLLQDPFGGIFVDIDMTQQSELVLDPSTLTSLFIIVVASDLPPWIRGDVNGDGSIDISDSVGLLDQLFGQGTIGCLDSADSNDDGGVNIADAVYQLAYLFSGGEPPPEPFPRCGFDPTVDSLDCASATPCP